MEDKKVTDEASLLSYLNIVVDNLRSNNKKIRLNSYQLVASSILFIFIQNSSESLTSVNFLFLTVENASLILYLIPIYFSFILFHNVMLWNHNINLNRLFDSLSNQAFLLSPISDTKNILRPFSILLHVINYQTNNKKVSGLLKAPSTIGLAGVIFSPLIFLFYTIYVMATIDIEPFIIPISSIALTILLFLATIVHAFNPSKTN